MTNFKIPKNDWKSIPLNSAKFILEEGKDYHEYTLKESERITSRAYSLVLLLSAILSAIVGYTYSKLVDKDLSKIIYLNFYFTFIISFFVCWLAKLIFPRKIMAKGRKPNELAKSEFLINPKLNKEENYLSFIIQEIENTEAKINYNLDKNKSRRSTLEIIMYSIAVLFPVYLIIAFFIAN